MEDTKVVLDVINKAPEIKTVFKYWYDDNAFKSSFLHALSSVFYGGEKFFMKSLNHSSKEHPEFKEEVRNFVIQENNHSKAHQELNREIDRIYGNEVLQDLEFTTDEILVKLYSKLPQELNLIITEALEHITYNLCESILERQDVLDTTYSDAKKLFVYHCIEEVGEGHSSIASKIADKVITKWHYKLARKLAITPIALSLVFVLFLHLKYIYRCNRDIRVRETITGLNDLFGFEGWVREGFVSSIKTWQKNKLEENIGYGY